jgi:ubiquinone/menaquinone biosynthesis C-methylase UbiE
MNDNYFLPGTDKQLDFLTENLDVTGLSILIIGTGCEEISHKLLAKGASKVIIIVDDNDSLLTSRLLLSNSGVSVRMMEYDNTDFKDSEFDLVYAQASVSNKKRNKITKEVYRVLKAGGHFCVGEVTSLTKTPPQFIIDLWKNSGVSPLHVEEQEQYYKGRKFDIVKSEDLSYTLKDFYMTSISLLSENLDKLTEQEKSYYKKLLNIISHESNAYLRLGGDAHIGFYAYIFKKGEL